MTDETRDLQTATAPPTPPLPLNPKQARFVQEYLVGLNATQACLRAGYSKRGAGNAGNRLLKHPGVAAAILIGKKDLAERCNVRQEWVIERLKDVHDAAMERPDGGPVHNAAAANRALELIGKHGGMWADGVAAGDVKILVNVHPHGDGRFTKSELP